jgi:DNA-binding NtrC family response regulator
MARAPLQASGATSRPSLARLWRGAGAPTETDDDRIVIALIEDDPLLRVPLARALDDAGYKVVAGATGFEGLTMLEAPTVDLAIVDVRLPGRLDGIALVTESLRANPNLRIILTSGHPPPPGLARRAPFLPKPFRVEDLLATVERTLAAPMDWHDRTA